MSTHLTPLPVETLVEGGDGGFMQQKYAEWIYIPASKNPDSDKLLTRKLFLPDGK